MANYPQSLVLGGDGSTFPPAGTEGQALVTYLGVTSWEQYLRDSFERISVNWFDRLLYYNNGITSLDWDTGRGLDSTGQSSFFWNTRELNDADGLSAGNWDRRQLFDSNTMGEIISVDWENRQLYDSDGTHIRLDWSFGYLYNDPGTQVVLDWRNGLFLDNSGSPTLDWFNRVFSDGASVQCMQWGSRILVANDGTSVLDWSNPVNVSILTTLSTAAGNLYDFGAVANATLPLVTVLTKRAQVIIDGTTYYVPLSTTAF